VAVLAAVSVATLYSPTLAAIGAAYIVGAAVMTAIWSVKAVREEQPSIEPKRVRDVARGSYHYGITFALYEVLLRVDVMMLALWRELSEVGLYTAGFKLADVGLKAGTMTMRVIAPVLYEQSANAPDRYRRTCKVVLRGMSMLAVGGCLTLALVAEPLITLVFGDAFRAAATVLAVLALSLVVRLIAAVLLIVLSASGDHGRRTGALGAGLAVAVAANAALIPAYGMIGAAIARTVGDSVYLGAMLGARRLPCARLEAARWVLAPIVIGVAAYVVAVNLPVHFVLQLVAGLALYGVALFVTGTLDVRELRDLKAMLPKRGRN
jgi:stage V sporulation protein B